MGERTPLLFWVVSFLSGAAVMVVELTGARILAPAFGASLVPWTAVIASVLLGVALGNAWGGSRSRGDPGRSLVLLLAVSALAVLAPLLRSGLPNALAAAIGPVAGSLALAAALFLPSSFLLGALGPLLVRAATRDLSEVGWKSGSLNGAHHVGAIAGTVGTGFLLIPLLPVSWILLLTAAVLAVCAGAVAKVVR